MPSMSPNREEGQETRRSPAATEGKQRGSTDRRLRVLEDWVVLSLDGIVILMVN